MTPKKIAFIAGTVSLVVFIIWDQQRRSPELQVPATFARLATAMNEHDASGVMACVDRSYDFTGKWPNLFPEPTKARGLAQQGLAFAFLRAGQDVSVQPPELARDHLRQMIFDLVCESS